MKTEAEILKQKKRMEAMKPSYRMFEFEVKEVKGEKLIIIKPSIYARLFKKELTLPLRWVLEEPFSTERARERGR